MAKLFEQVEEREVAPAKHKWLSLGFILKCVYIVNIIGALAYLTINVFWIEGKKERDKNKNNMELVQIVKMDNGKILTRQVKYVTFKKVDPEDTSDIFYEVLNAGDSKFTVGTLVKFPHRFVNLQQIEGEKYCIIDPAEIQFHIEKEDVKEDLLKR
jgi:hypothetical protein